MIQFPPSSFVPAIVDARLPQGSFVKKVVIFSFDVEAHKKDGSNKGAKRTLHIIFQRTADRVLIAITSLCSFAEPKTQGAWLIVSRNDPEWRRTGVANAFLHVEKELAEELGAAAVTLRYEATLLRDPLELNVLDCHYEGRCQIFHVKF